MSGMSTLSPVTPSEEHTPTVTILRAWAREQYKALPADMRQLGDTTFHTLVYVYDKAYNPTVGNVWKKSNPTTLYATQPRAQNMPLEQNGKRTVLQQLWAILLHLSRSARDLVPKYPKGGIPALLLNDDGRRLSEVEAPCVYRRISPAERIYWGEAGNGKDREEQHSGPPKTDSAYDRERRRFPDASQWDARSALELDVTVPSTFRHVIESMYSALSSSTNSAASLNTRLFDFQFFKKDLLVAPAGVRLFLEAVTAHVESGGLLPKKADHDNWIKLFGHVVPGISAAWMYVVARDQFRRDVATPYLAAHPIPVNAWEGYAPEQGGVRGKRRILKDRPTTSNLDQHTMRADLAKYGLGSKKLKR